MFLISYLCMSVFHVFFTINMKVSCKTIIQNKKLKEQAVLSQPVLSGGVSLPLPHP
jgi:hypothetical protein